MLEEFEGSIDDLRLIPSKGGVFEVVVDDELVYSKKATGKHADHDDVLKAIRQLG